MIQKQHELAGLGPAIARYLWRFENKGALESAGRNVVAARSNLEAVRLSLSTSHLDGALRAAEETVTSAEASLAAAEVTLQALQHGTPNGKPVGNKVSFLDAHCQRCQLRT